MSWFRDSGVRKIARFGVPVALGKLVASLAGLGTLAILARHLGVATFGVLAVIRTVVAVLDQFANFNTWQALIKYGAEAIVEKRPLDLKQILKLAVLVDLTTGILSVVLLVLFAVAIPGRLGLSSHEAWLCVLYGLTLVTRVAGASDGIFRLADEYRIQATTSGIGAVVAAAAVAIAVLMGASLDGCVVALVLGEVVANLLTTISSFWVARRFGCGGWWRVSLKGIRTSCPGIVRFLAATNAQLTVKKAQVEFDMLVVASMLGKTAAGLFRVVKQLGSIPAKVFMPFEQVLFTELSRLAAGGEYLEFRRLLGRFAAIVAAGSVVIWVLSAVLATPVIRLVAGDDFVDAAASFRWYMLAMVLMVANAPVQRALVALGRPGTLFLFDLASFGVLFVAAVLGAREWGLVGVALAVAAHKAVQLVWSTWLVRTIALQRHAEMESST